MTRSDTMSSTPRTPRENSKTDRLLTLLRTGTGASLDDMTEATGWQPHTVRAAMTGLRKRGFEIKRHVEGNTTVPTAHVEPHVETRFHACVLLYDMAERVIPALFDGAIITNAQLLKLSRLRLNENIRLKEAKISLRHLNRRRPGIAIPPMRRKLPCYRNDRAHLPAPHSCC